MSDESVKITPDVVRFFTATVKSVGANQILSTVVANEISKEDGGDPFRRGQLQVIRKMQEIIEKELGLEEDYITKLESKFTQKSEIK